MKSGLRIAALFLGYGAIGFGGDYAVGLFAQNADDEFRYEFEYAIEVDPDIEVDVEVDIDPEIVVDVQVRHSGDCRYELERTLEIPATLANSLAIRAGSGEMRVEGRQGLDQIEVVGRVCASHEEYLEELTLGVERSGQEIILSAHYPQNRNSWRGQNTAKIDLTVLMPLNMDVDIEDSSGSMEVYGTGALRIDDSSGSIQVEGANGSVWIDDSSGSLSVRDVAGDLEIKDGSGSISVVDVQGTVRLDDGSGSIQVSEVDQSVIVEDDGSGSIRVSSVGGDFIVRDDGSGGIRHSDVRGTVDIPADKKRGRRGN